MDPQSRPSRQGARSQAATYPMDFKTASYGNSWSERPVRQEWPSPTNWNDASPRATNVVTTANWAPIHAERCRICRPASRRVKHAPTPATTAFARCGGNPRSHANLAPKRTIDAPTNATSTGRRPVCGARRAVDPARRSAGKPPRWPRSDRNSPLNEGAITAPHPMRSRSGRTRLQ